MKMPLCFALLLAACAHTPLPSVEFSPPPAAATREDLIQGIPPGLFRGDFAAISRRGDASEYLTFVFLKDEPEDQVPMRVALYERKQGQALSLRFVAATPFSKGECRRGECRARIAEMAEGFQITRESFGADHLRADYRFVRRRNDLELSGKGFQTKDDRGETCSVFYDFAKRRILRRRGKEARIEKMGEGAPPRLIADQLKFETAMPETLCALPATRP